MNTKFINLIAITTILALTVILSACTPDQTKTRAESTLTADVPAEVKISMPEGITPNTVMTEEYVKSTTKFRSIHL